VRVVVDAELVRHGQEERVGGSDGGVLLELLDEFVGLVGIGSPEDRARVRVDVADLVALLLPPEVGAIAVVDTPSPG
jgi:hypothetical protein